MHEKLEGFIIDKVAFFFSKAAAVFSRLKSAHVGDKKVFRAALVATTIMPPKATDNTRKSKRLSGGSPKEEPAKKSMRTKESGAKKTTDGTTDGTADKPSAHGVVKLTDSTGEVPPSPKSAMPELFAAPPSGKKKTVPFKMEYKQLKTQKDITKDVLIISCETFPANNRLCRAIKENNSSGKAKFITGKWESGSYHHEDVDMPGCIITGSKQAQNYQILISADSLIKYYSNVDDYVNQWTEMSKRLLNDEEANIKFSPPLISAKVDKDDENSRIMIIPTAPNTNVGFLHFDAEYANLKDLYWKIDSSGTWHAKTTPEDLDSDFAWVKWKLDKHNYFASLE